MWDPYAEFHSAVLPNGLTVHAAEWKDRPYQMVGFLVHTGARHDPVGLEGLSHFVEHLVHNNSSLPPDELTSLFENWGGSVNFGITSYSATSYSFFAPYETWKMARAFDLFGEMLLHARLTKCIERERKVIVGEFHQNFPYQFSYDLEVEVHQSLGKGHWLNRFARPIGSLDSIARIKRKDLQAHYDRCYTPSNISVVGIGAMNLDRLVAYLRNSPFQISKPGERAPLPEPLNFVPVPRKNRKVVKVSKFIKLPLRTGQYESVALIPGTIPKRAVRLFASMLNQLLMREIRHKRGWSYDVDCQLIELGDVTRFEINCKGLHLDGLSHIEGLVNSVIASVPQYEEMFETEKKKAIARMAMNDVNVSEVCSDSLGDLEIENRIISLGEWVDRVRQIQAVDMKAIAIALRPSQRHTTIARP